MCSSLSIVICRIALKCTKMFSLKINGDTRGFLDTERDINSALVFTYIVEYANCSSYSNFDIIVYSLRMAKKLTILIL